MGLGRGLSSPEAGKLSPEQERQQPNQGHRKGQQTRRDAEAKLSCAFLGKPGDLFCPIGNQPGFQRQVEFLQNDLGIIASMKAIGGATDFLIANR